MKITVKLHGELKNAFRCKEITTDIDDRGGTVVDVILKLMEQERIDDGGASILIPGNNAIDGKNARALKPGLLLLVNDVDARLLGGLAANVHDGDVVTLLPSIHGG